MSSEEMSAEPPENRLEKVFRESMEVLNKSLENLNDLCCSETSTPRMPRSNTVAGTVMTSTPASIIQRSVSEVQSGLESSRPHSSSLTTLNSNDTVDSHVTSNSKANLTISTVSDQVRYFRFFYSLLLNLRGWKTADKDAYWFSFEVSLFSPISNENLP